MLYWGFREVVFCNFRVFKGFSVFGRVVDGLEVVFVDVKRMLIIVLVVEYDLDNFVFLEDKGMSEFVVYLGVDC